MCVRGGVVGLGQEHAALPAGGDGPADGRLDPLFPDHHTTPSRQALPIVYHPNGAVYVAEIAAFRAVRDFVAWGLAEGQQYGAEFGYVPLSADVIALGRDVLDTVEK